MVRKTEHPEGEFRGLRCGWDQGSKRDHGLNLQSDICRAVLHLGFVLRVRVPGRGGGHREAENSITIGKKSLSLRAKPPEQHNIIRACLRKLI